MLNKILSVGLADDLPRYRKSRVYVMNRISIVTIGLILFLSFMNIFAKDDLAIFYYYSFYLFIALLILFAHHQKRYNLSDYVINILYPVGFFLTAITIGADYQVEYLLFLTGATTNYYAEKGRIKHFLFAWNVLLLIAIKIYFAYYPAPLIDLNPAFILFFTITISLFIIILFYLFLEINSNTNTRLKKKLRKLTNKQEQIIEERTTEIQKKSAALEESNYELNRFASISAHDLREPLRNIMGFAQLLERNLIQGKTTDNLEYLEYIKKGVARMDTITNDIVDYTRLETKISQISEVDTNEIVDNICIDFMEYHSNLIITKEVLPSLKINETLCQNLFHHLIKNAIQYCNQSTIIVNIKCKIVNDFYQFEIHDNGIGIEKDYFETIFELFKRLHNDSKYAGSGIGLAICKKIIKAYNGTIWLESEVNTGSIFYFKLPLNTLQQKTRK